MTDNSRSTIKFKVPGEDKDEMRSVLRSVFDALTEKGYNPINQIVGYLLTEDPTYITNHLDARRLIRKIDRYGLLADIVANYFDDTEEHVSGGAPAGQHQFERSEASI